VNNKWQSIDSLVDDFVKEHGFSENETVLLDDVLPELTDLLYDAHGG
jgi:hypothetical protein